MEKPSYQDLPREMKREEVPAQNVRRTREVIVVGGGIAGLSAAIYLARAMRDVLVIDAGESLALWEPEVQNYLGFPECIDGRDLLRRGKAQAERYGAEFVREEIERLSKENGIFTLQGKRGVFECSKLLLATGVYHLPPKIPAVDECIGKSVFFCKDCDGYRVQGKDVMVAGHNNEAVRYALGLLAYTDCVTLLTNGEVPSWDNQHECWLREYKLPVFIERIVRLQHSNGMICTLFLSNGLQIETDCIFTTRGDVYHNHLAKQLGARLDAEGQVLVDKEQRTSIPGLFAAGCVTPANCQMIIAAGDGATAAQSINCEMFEESLRNGTLRQRRQQQINRGQTLPQVASQFTHN